METEEEFQDMAVPCIECQYGGLPPPGVYKYNTAKLILKGPKGTICTCTHCGTQFVRTSQNGYKYLNKD